jgi:hypothetical protein
VDARPFPGYEGKLNRSAMDFIEEAVTETKKPFFLYLAHIASHWPLQAKP